VALPALLDTSTGGVALLGLPPLLDELRDLPPLPPIRCGTRRLLRPRPQARATPRRWGSRLLGRRCGGHPPRRAGSRPPRPADGASAP